MFDELSKERMGLIRDLSEQIDFNNLSDYFKSKDIKGPLTIYRSIFDGDIPIEDTEKDQNQFKLDLNEITRGNPKHKLEDQMNTIKNI